MLETITQSKPGENNSSTQSPPSSPRRKFQVMTLSDAAAERVRDVIAAAQTPIIGIRVGVKNGGCAGMAYTMEYAAEKAPHDEVIEEKGVTILIDPKAVLFLLGTQMDVKTDKFASTFVFKNPNETSACGCGESVAITPAKMEGMG
jgi:iron-sulfur cluster assembly protein